ncbi:hypothetical protein [Halosimplex pelagicum]|uniref:DUF8054 domain-containing protein n=1 Tax=Halosimplex pelagicum TaxID=869886 RepID=A0A7D5T983_9EURY|nr:hypothetical protein [Halosimplex pelagicum]QLH81670.1 hypothetical protein HZS54_08545 [Halosimplex pelagicum]
MKLPEGRLLRSRVVEDPRTVLVDALDRELTGYAVFEPQDALLLEASGRGVVTFRAGVPVVAYHTDTDRAGPPALADLAAEGPYRLRLFALAPADLEAVHDRPTFRIPPGMAAERLAGDPALADRTRAAAPPDRRSETAGSPGDPTDAAAGDDDVDSDERQPGAVEAFLDDAEKIEAIREQARAEAAERADEWGFDDVA